MCRTFCCLLAFILASIAFLISLDAPPPPDTTSLAWFQKHCQSQRIIIITQPQDTSLWTRGSEDFRNTAVISGVPFEMTWVKKISPFQYKQWRTTDNHNLIYTIKMSLFQTLTNSVGSTVCRIGSPTTRWQTYRSKCTRSKILNLGA